MLFMRRFAILLTGSIAVSATAQQPALEPADSDRSFCGTTLTDEAIAAELERLESGFYDEFQGPETRGPGDYKFMRIALHVVRRSDGTGAISPATIQSAINTSNDQFELSRMVLIIVSVDTIDSDTYYTITEPEDDALRQMNVVSGALNIYFVGDAPYCGESTFPGDDIPGIVVQNSCIDSGGVLSHEIGHYFNLYHTHETFGGVDCPGGPFCATRGDLCCDTPPDPGL